MNHATLKIPAGQSETGTLELHNQAVGSVHMPDDWTAADLTVVGSVTGKDGSFLPVYDQEGTEVTISAAAGRLVLIDTTLFRGLRYCRLRSGTDAAPVAQVGERNLTVLLRDDTLAG